MLSLGTVSGNIIPLKMTIQKILKGEIFQLSLNEFLKRKEEKKKEAYLTASLGEELLESSTVHSLRGSTKGKLEILMLGIHSDMSIWS